MAYMSKEHVKTIRENLKKKFPEFKFSVSNENYTGVNVAIMSSPYDFETEYKAIHWRWLEKGSHSEKLKEIFDVINEGNHDNSDSMTDYFDVGFYVHFSIGKWNKPYQIKKG